MTWLLLGLAQAAPDLSGWDLRCVGACTIARDEALTWTADGGTVYIEYHGLVLTERRATGTLTVDQTEGRMTATFSDGEVLQRPQGPQIRLLVDPSVSPEQLEGWKKLLNVMAFEEAAAPEGSSLEVRHLSGQRALANALAERLEAPTVTLPPGTDAHIVVVLGPAPRPPVEEVQESVQEVEAPPPSRCGCQSSGGPWSATLALLLFGLSRRRAPRSGVGPRGAGRSG